MSQEITLINEYFNEDIYFNNPQQVYEELKWIYELKKEFFIAFYLDSKNKIIAREIISIGTLNSSLIHPRELFKGAVLRSANSIILSHNHPSGSLEPSEEDISTTKKLIDCGELLGIKILDHIIVSHRGFKSIMEDLK